MKQAEPQTEYHSRPDISFKGETEPFRLPWWQSLLLGLATGGGGSLVGVGGGIIMVPFLTMWGMGQKKAQGTSLVVITALVPIAIFSYYRLGNIDFSFAVPLAIGGAIGGFVGSSLCQRYSNRVLAKLFSIFLLLIAIRLIFMPHYGEREAVDLLTVVQYIEPLLFGLLAGAVAGFFGVGGGVVFVPTGVLLAGLPQVIAQGSSFMAMLPTTVVSSLTYSQKREIEWQIIKWMIPGAWIGTFIGSYAADLIPGRILQVIFAVFLAISAARKLIAKSLSANNSVS